LANAAALKQFVSSATAITMHPLILQAFNESERRKKSLLSLVEPVSETDKFLNHREGKWSISQILAHLVQAEETSLNYMKKKALGIDGAGDTGVVEDLKFLFLKISQRLPLKYKAPAVLGEGAPPSPEFVELVNRWGRLREDIRMFLETIREEHVHRKIYRHVVVGRLNVIQAIKFFDEHLLHHQPQIKRLLE
jgi:hypothetical protein